MGLAVDALFWVELDICESGVAPKFSQQVRSVRECLEIYPIVEGSPRDVGPCFSGGLEPDHWIWDAYVQIAFRLQRRHRVELGERSASITEDLAPLKSIFHGDRVVGESFHLEVERAELYSEVLSGLG